MFHTVLFDRDRVMVPDEKGITVLRLPLEAKADRFDLPGENTFWRVMLRPGGTLSTWASGSRAIQRWGVPD
jgi:hypothetical protein